MKKTWTHISLPVIGLVCALQVQAEPVDMGGFQIQVEEKGETEINPEQDGNEKTEWDPVPSDIRTQKDGADEVTVQTGTSISQTEEEWELFSEEKAVAEQETDTGVSLQTVEEMGEIAEPSPEMMPEEEVIQEEIPDIRQEEQVQPGELEKEAQRGGTKKKKDKKVKKEREVQDERKAQQKISFIHEDRARLLDKSQLAVRLEGEWEQAVCILSCAVNRRECVYRWEDGCLMPVEPFLQKGMNCMELTVLLGDGQVFTMEPWYFSCGVGLAML